MALSAIPDDSDWPQEILDVVLPEFWATVDIVDPVEGTYDVNTNTVGTSTDTAVITARPARIQNVRLPLETAGAYEWSGKSRYLFQIEARSGDPLIKKGMVIRVSNGGGDSYLEQWTFHVVGVTTSSHAPIHNIETYTEYGVKANA